MIRILTLIPVLFSLVGCAAMIPSPPPVSEQYPAVYSKLVEAVPVCADERSKGAGLETYCRWTAHIIRLDDPIESTGYFLELWEGLIQPTNVVVPAYYNNPAAATLTSKNISITMANSLARVAVPALKYIYETHPSEYSAKMKKTLRIVRGSSRASYETFSRRHYDLVLGE